MSFGFHTWNDAHDVSQVVNPVAGAGTTDGTWLSMLTYTKGVAIVNVGVVDGTIDASIRQATDSSGTSAKALSNASITQLTSSDDNKIALIEWDTQKMDHSNNFTHATVRLVKTQATDLAGATLIRTRAKGMPVGNSNLEEAVEVLSN